MIGSQAVPGQLPNAPAELRRSMEADLWPRNRPGRWELGDGSIGELSPFQRQRQRQGRRRMAASAAAIGSALAVWNPGCEHPVPFASAPAF